MITCAPLSSQLGRHSEAVPLYEEALSVLEPLGDGYRSLARVRADYEQCKALASSQATNTVLSPPYDGSTVPTETSPKIDGESQSRAARGTPRCDNAGSNAFKHAQNRYHCVCSVRVLS